jgi:hypothetical protein
MIDHFNVKLSEILMTPQEIHAAILHEDIDTIEDEQKLICERQLAKALWVMARNLELANDEAIAKVGKEPLWSLKDLAIYCRDQLESKGLKKPSIV